MSQVLSLIGDGIIKQIFISLFIFVTTMAAASQLDKYGLAIWKTAATKITLFMMSFDVVFSRRKYVTILFAFASFIGFVIIINSIQFKILSTQSLAICYLGYEICLIIIIRMWYLIRGNFKLVDLLLLSIANSLLCTIVSALIILLAHIFFIKMKPPEYVTANIVVAFNYIVIGDNSVAFADIYAADLDKSKDQIVMDTPVAHVVVDRINCGMPIDKLLSSYIGNQMRDYVTFQTDQNIACNLNDYSPINTPIIGTIKVKNPHYGGRFSLSSGYNGITNFSNFEGGFSFMVYNNIDGLYINDAIIMVPFLQSLSDGGLKWDAHRAEFDLKNASVISKSNFVLFVTLYSGFIYWAINLLIFIMICMSKYSNNVIKSEKSDILYERPFFAIGIILMSAYVYIVICIKLYNYFIPM